MKATRTNRRRSAVDPHPEFADAVSVSRFWSLVDRRTDDECWTWLGDVDKDGYGVFVFRGRKRGAHEFALSFTSGEKRLPVLDTCHSCDEPSCVNPAHLRFDTRKANVADMFDHNRANTPTPKLTAEDVVLMRERRANGARQLDLAETFGVSSGYVSEVVRGLVWAHVGGPIQPNRKAS